MKRTIKFRAWDGKVMMYGVESLHYPLSQYQTSDLMQYTGLKDSKGVEIYEGDIVEEKTITCVGVSCPPDSFTLKKHVVELRPPRYWLKDEDMGWEGEGFVLPEDCEVIGDIYQNPDLLT